MGGRGRIRDGDSQSARASTRTRQPELGEIYSSRRHAACAKRGIAIQSSRAKPRDPEEVKDFATGSLGCARDDKKRLFLAPRAPGGSPPPNCRTAQWRFMSRAFSAGLPALMNQPAARQFGIVGPDDS